MSFINFSNHPSTNWSAEQLAAAKTQVIDLAFPAVPSGATKAEVAQMAADCTEKILALSPDTVMCQGEMTLAFAVANLLMENGIRVVAACSERVTIDLGEGKKQVQFNFVQFREY